MNFEFKRQVVPLGAYFFFDLMWLNVANCGSHTRATYRHLAPSGTKRRNVVFKKKIFRHICAKLSDILKYHFVVECG